MAGPPPPSSRRAFVLTLAVVAAMAFLPFVRGLLAGGALYFRDLATIFHPFRHFVVEGLRQGEIRFWDPYVHEGIPLPYLPIAYPPDLLQVLWPGPRGVSWVLAAHVPLAAITFVLLARALGRSLLAAGTGALVYALGGFSLSMVNLYVYVEALAWAPLVVLGLVRTVEGRGRDVALAGLAVAVCLSTTGVEVALQAIVVGAALSFRPPRRAALLWPSLAVAVGGLLAAPLLLVMRGTMEGTERARGFSVDVVLNQSVHPFTLVQVLVADLYGDLSALPDRWWGSNFFDRGFPYVVSLYLGATVLALAVTGLACRFREGRRLALLGGLALLAALGRFGGLGPVVELVPEPLRMFRYPAKTFFTVEVAVALLAALGVDALRTGPAAWKVLAAVAGGLGLTLAGLPVLPRVASGGADWFVRHFFPPALPLPTRVAYFHHVLADAAQGGLVALAAAAVAALAARGRVRTPIAAGVVVSLAVADLLRAGAGVNPMIDPAFLRASPEVVDAVRALPGRQRLFTCDPQNSRVYWRARAAQPTRHELLTFAVWNDTLTPNYNRPAHVPTALSADLTSLVPLARILPAGAGCHDPGPLVPRLRQAGVSHVLSLDPVEHDSLPPVGEIAPRRLHPLRVRVYRVPDPLPLRALEGASGEVKAVRETPDEIAFSVSAGGPATLLVRDGWSRGWSATVDGAPVPLLRTGEHRAVRVPAGTSVVRMEYRPPGLAAGLALAGLGAVALLVLGRVGR